MNSVSSTPQFFVSSQRGRLIKTIRINVRDFPQTLRNILLGYGFVHEHGELLIDDDRILVD